MKSLKKLTLFLLAAALAATSLSLTAFADVAAEPVWGDVQQDNFVRVSSAEGFAAGTTQNLAVSEEIGDGALVLTEGQEQGVWTSPEITVPAFEYLVATWGADTPADSWVSVDARAYVPMHNDWSDWMTWGKWGTGVQRTSMSKTSSLAEMDTDTLIILGSDGETADRIQLRVTLHSSSDGQSPAFRQVSCTMKNTLDGQAIPVYSPHAGEALPDEVLLDTPCYSQMVRDPAIANIMCSPTSMTMMLNDRGQTLFPEETALWEYDFGYNGFGNWSFTSAIAGSFGYSSYAQYGDLDFVRHELAAGRSVALSVQYSSQSGGSYPFLENGAANNTGGHLICIVGYGSEGGRDYFWSNDAAATGDVNCVRRKYWADQLDVCWTSRIVYAVSSQPEAGAGFASPVRQTGEMVPAELEGQYILKVNGEELSLGDSFANMTSNFGSGSAFLILDSAAAADLPEGVKTTEANRETLYLRATSSGQINFNSSTRTAYAGKTGTVYVVKNDGTSYAASISFPQVEQQPAEDLPADETPAEPAAKTNDTAIIIGIAAAVVVVIAVVVVVSKKKKG